MDDQLKIFVAVANNHSFNKAANQLFISAPAVIKQINALENSIKVQLFNRTHNGVFLTKAGESFYQDATKLIAAYDQSINRAQDLSSEKQTLKIGAGPLATGTGTTNLWLEIGRKNPNLVFQFIPCSCSLGSFNEFLASINKDFDLVSSIYDLNLLKKYNLEATELDITPLKISVPIQNPLAKKEKLAISDLENQTVALPIKGEFTSFDHARDLLSKNAKIRIQNISGFDMNVLNSCVKNDWLLCSADDWQTAHPMLKAKNVDWDCSVPFGLVYGKKHNAAVSEVLNYVMCKRNNGEA
jgi:DNA-binding transcriptional LysR family regulator